MVFASNADQTGPKQPRNKGFLPGLVQIRPKPGNVIGGKIGGKNAVERWRYFFAVLRRLLAENSFSGRS